VTVPAVADQIGRPFAMRRSTSSVLMLVLAALSWGLATALTKVALEQLAPLDLLGVELLTGTACLLAIALARGVRPARPGLVVLAIGVLDPGLCFLLFDVGIARTAATDAALLIATESLFTAILAILFLGERLDARLAFALCVGSVGAVLVSLHGGGGASSLTGDLLVVAASLAAGAYSVLARRLAPGREVLSMTIGQMLGGTLICLPASVVVVLVGHSHLAHADAGHLLAAVAVGVLASVVPFLLFNTAIEHVSATAAGLVLTLIPLFGAGAAVALLSEGLGAGQFAGGALIVLAATLAALAARPAPTPQQAST
jgi:drug/metabolite transporter (DMT)-like permease